MAHFECVEFFGNSRFCEMSSIDAKWLRTLFATSRWHILKDGRILWKHLADFMKTNLTEFAVIWVKRHQKASFLGPISSKITLTKEKERRKRKSEDKERRRKQKKTMVALLVSRNGYFWGSFWPFGGNVFKNIYSSQMKTYDVFFNVF